MRFVFLSLAAVLILGFVVFLNSAEPLRADVTLQVEVIILSPTPTPTATPTPTSTVAPTQAPSGGGGGGGGGVTRPPIELTGPANVEFEGYAYPGALIHVLKDGDEVGQTIADNSGNFTFKLFNLSSGTYNFGFWATDRLGRRSITFAFQFTLSSGSVSKISAIVMPPTIGLNRASVSPGENIIISGASTPAAQIRIQVASSPKEYLTKALLSGDYSQTFSTSGLEKGLHTAKSKTEVTKTGNESVFSQLVAFGVGVPAPQEVCGAKPDINKDGKVNLIDFSIMAYWWKRPLASGSLVDLNCDGKLNLVDFSILAYNWTG